MKELDAFKILKGYSEENKVLSPEHIKEIAALIGDDGKMIELIVDNIRDYLNGVENLEELTNNLIFWKRQVQSGDITADDYFEEDIE